MNLVEILVCLPINDSNYDAYLKLEKCILELAGGFTAMEAKGGWINPNTKLTETEKVFRIEFTTTPDIAGVIKAIFIDVLTRETKEESLYWRVTKVVGDPIINLRKQ